VVSPGEVVLPPGNRLEPDVLVLRTHSLADAWLAAARLLAVEIMSPGSRVYDRDFKGPAYLALGVRECWRVDLVERTIATNTTDTPETIFRDRLVWQPGITPRTLVLDLEEIFRNIP
jgi:Uma2 family endonuclease